MSENERQPWEQQEGEPTKWFSRFCVFCQMKPWERSVVAVFNAEESGEKQRKAEPSGYWYEKAKQYNWEERARVYDAYIRSREDKIIAEEREQILRSGFALMHKRVQELDRLSHKLIEMVEDEEKVWIPEIRTFTTGEDSTQTVEKVTFNAPLFLVIEKYFAGIAAELGERVKKKDIAITELPPNVYMGFDPNKDGSEP